MPEHDHSPEAWDERHEHRGDDVWSTDPHPALVHLAHDLEPGRALELGCGEGADAVWLAERGWEVVAIDISEVVLGRAQDLAHERGVAVEWHRADVTAWLPDGPFHLVVSVYPAVASAEGLAGRVADLVGPGGRFIGVWHGPAYAADAKARGFEPGDYLQPDHILPDLHSGAWALVVDELRPHEEGDGEDRVILARRKSA